MNIVIVGAGKLGIQVASLFSKEEYNVFLIDSDQKKLQDASLHLDIATKLGSGTDWLLLDDLLELSPDLILALTGSDEKNIITCTLAKHLGYPRTICRLKDNRYLNKSRLDFPRIFNVDYFICQELLVAEDIRKYLFSPGSILLEYFAHGAVEMRTLLIPDKWREFETPLKELPLPEGVMIGFVRSRFDTNKKLMHENKTRTFFPHGKDTLFPGDEVTFIGETSRMTTLHEFFGIFEKKLSSCVIVGGTDVGIHLAKILTSQNVEVRVIDKSFEKCSYLAEILPNCTIMFQDGTDLEFLKSEKVGKSDAFISCTNTDETNLLAATIGKQAGCTNTVCVLSNKKSYDPILPQFDISHFVSFWTSTESHLLSLTSTHTVSSLFTLYEKEAEVVEVTISSDSKIVGIPISELGPILPKDFLIAVIQNRGRVMIANGNRIISPGDTVIVICHPRHFHELEKIF